MWTIPLVVQSSILETLNLTGVVVVVVNVPCSISLSLVWSLIWLLLVHVVLLVSLIRPSKLRLHLLPFVTGLIDATFSY